MGRRALTWSGFVAAAIILPLTAVAIFGSGDATITHAVTADALSIDCDTVTAGIQPGCTISSPGTLTVNIVYTNNSGSAHQLATFNFDVFDPDKTILNPTAPPVANLVTLRSMTGDCASPAPQADTGAYPVPNADSSLSCTDNLGTGDAVPAGDTVIASLTYSVLKDGVAPLVLVNVNAADDGGNTLFACDAASGAPTPPGTNANPIFGPCTGSVVGVGSSPPTATSTTTITPTPTATSTPCGGGACATPIGVPTGAPNAVLALNSSNCITLGIAFGGLGATAALSDCGGLGRQNGPFAGSMQHFVSCLRGDIYYGQHYCVDPSTVSQVFPSDFAKIDLDRDQVHQGQDLIVLAFVDADYPVAFATDRGQFVSSSVSPLGQAYTCFQGNVFLPLGTGDPDCDGDPATAGDGVVVALLRVDATTPRGTGHITVTQGATSIVKDFTVVGIPQSITFTTLAGKTSIETGATAPPPAGSPPGPSDCSFTGLADALTGLPDAPQKAVVIAKALDSDGHEVVGSLLSWSHPFVGTFSGPLGGARDPLPQGGVAVPFIPMIDLGSAGIGFPQILCGGDTPGTLTEDVSFVGLLEGGVADPTYHASYSIEVTQAGAPTPTATASATITPTATATTANTTTTPTETITPSATASLTANGTATSTPTATSTAPAPTATPGPAPCLTIQQKISLVLGIVHRFGAHTGEPRYDIRFDLNYDGVINVTDLLVVVRTPRCRR